MKKEILYKKIADALARQIRCGVWKTGEKIPSLRAVCREHGVGLNTAVRAFAELEDCGLIAGRPKSGFIVKYVPARPETAKTTRPSAGTPNREERDLIAEVYYAMDDFSVARFSMGVPEDALLPIAKLNKAMTAAMRSVEGSGTRYENTQGNVRLRENIARFASRGWDACLTADDIVTTHGATDAVALALSALTRRGDAVAVESPCYFGILQLANSLGLRVKELPTNPISGVELSALKKALPRIKACVLISNFSNPLGGVMPEEHKKEAVKMLAERNIPLIEDDIYGDVFFGDARPKPCKAFDDRGNVLWCGSFSKTLAPGYRVGWIAPGRFKEAVLRRKYVQHLSCVPVVQEAVAQFMEKDRYERHLRRLRRELHANCQHFMQTVADHFPDSAKIVAPRGGFMLWAELDEKIDTAKLYRRAMRDGISIAPGRMFTLQEQYRNCMRLSYGQRWRPFVEERLIRLGAIVKEML